jgi:hypothetical protein
MKLLDFYLGILQEREWSEKTPNPDNFDIQVYKDAFTKISVDPFHKVRPALQPTLYNLYIKNALGDYRGRYDRINARTHHGLGIDQFEKDKEKLRKGEEYSKNYLPPQDSRLRFKQGGYPTETNEPDQFNPKPPPSDLGPIPGAPDSPGGGLGGYSGSGVAGGGDGGAGGGGS